MRGVVAAISVVVMGGLMAVVSCTETTDPPVRDAGHTEASSEIPDASGSGGSFDPTKYPTDCEEDSDCIIVPRLEKCFSCCSSDMAVSRVPAERDHAAAEGACERRGECTMACLNRTAACIDKRCVLQQADAGGQ